MRISSKETIAGYPVLKIRKMLNRNESTRIEIIMDDLKIDEPAAREVLGVLQQLEYVEKIKNEDGWYALTIKGNAFRQAKAIPPINRAKADLIFSDFLKRVQDVNSDPTYLYRVSKVILFGSYLKKEIEFVNDLDIIVEYEHKISDSKLRREADSKKRYTAQEGTETQKKINFKSTVHFLDYPLQEVRNYLKSKNKYLSLHHKSDIDLSVADHQQIFP